MKNKRQAIAVNTMTRNAIYIVDLKFVARGILYQVRLTIRRAALDIEYLGLRALSRQNMFKDTEEQ